MVPVDYHMTDTSLLLKLILNQFVEKIRIVADERYRTIDKFEDFEKIYIVHSFCFIQSIGMGIQGD
jgi:hypothetical protein